MSEHQSKPWIFMPRGNRTLEAKDFYISYSDSMGSIPIFRSDNNDSETALCKDDMFYILNGDWREQYEKVFDKGFDECIKIFLSHPANPSVQKNVMLTIKDSGIWQ